VQVVDRLTVEEYADIERRVHADNMTAESQV
jgi:hypothetical protein